MVKGKVNKTLGKTGIEYGQRNLNTIIGCKGDCPWDCWARRLVTTRMKAEFKDGSTGEVSFSDVKFIPERLDQPLCTKKPQRVLVNFMGDMWGDWVPAEWIEDTLDSCDCAPQHDYLFLTKNPKRYGDFITRFTNGNTYPFWKYMKPWLGTSVESREKVQRLYDLLVATKGTDVIRWVSLEPLIEPPMDWEMLECIQKMDWVVIGALTGEGAKQPDDHWVRWIIDACQEKNIPYFIKNNLDCEKLGIDRVQQYPKGRKVA